VQQQPMGVKVQLLFVKGRHLWPQHATFT
jgi:hypothetical protein